MTGRMKKRGKSFIAPASLARRVIAFFIDLTILLLIFIIPFRAILGRLLPTDLSSGEARTFLLQNPQIAGLLSLIFFTFGIFLLLYFSIFEYKLQQTPGKMLLGLYIIPGSSQMSFWSYLLSNITFLPIFPFTLLWVIDPIYLFFSPKNQRLMERLTNILVVQKYNY